MFSLRVGWGSLFLPLCAWFCWWVWEKVKMFVQASTIVSPNGNYDVLKLTQYIVMCTPGILYRILPFLSSLFHVFIICGYLQVHQVREADVLRQKAYMLFYVRDRVRSSVMHKDNGAANLSEKKLISEKITRMNGAIRNGLVETALNVSTFVNGDVKLQKRTSHNGQPSIISNTSQDQCSKNRSNTKVIEGAASRNNGTDSVQKGPCVHPDTAATLSTKTNETTSDSQKEITSPAEPDVITLHDQKAYEKPLQEQQLEPDGAFADSGEVTPAAFPTCNGADGLLGSNGQASEPRTDPFCKPTLDISNTAAIVQIIPTKVIMLCLPLVFAYF